MGFSHEVTVGSSHGREPNVTHFVISGVGIWESSVLFFLSDFMNLVDFCLLG